MDPDAAVDLLKEATQDAEKYLRAASRAATKAQALSLHKSARESLSEAGEVQRDLAMWMARGGYKPRRYDTWLARYVKAGQQWAAQGKVL